MARFEKEIFDRSFAYDMNEAKSCQIKAKENAMIFAYEDDGVFYQEIKQGDINL